jgi:hypothetical protein
MLGTQEKPCQFMPDHIMYHSVTRGEESTMSRFSNLIASDTNIYVQTIRISRKDSKLQPMILQLAF